MTTMTTTTTMTARDATRDATRKVYIKYIGLKRAAYRLGACADGAYVVRQGEVDVASILAADIRAAIDREDVAALRTLRADISAYAPAVRRHRGGGQLGQNPQRGVPRCGPRRRSGGGAADRGRLGRECPPAARGRRRQARGRRQHARGYRRTPGARAGQGRGRRRQGDGGGEGACGRHRRSCQGISLTPGTPP